MLLNQLMEGAHVLETPEDSNIMEAMSDEDMSQLMAVTLEDTLSPDEIDTFVAEMAEARGVDYVEERTIVKLDKAAKKQRNYKLAILQTAKDGNDPNYKKIVTLWKMERWLMQAMEKKWGTKAKAKVRTMGKKAEKSNAEPMKEVLPKLTRSQRDTQKAKNLKPLGGKLKAESNSVMKKMASKIK